MRCRPPTLFGRGALNAPLGSLEVGSDEEEEEGARGTEETSALPAEEDDEAFERRRGLRKGLGGVNFLLTLREHG